MFKVTRIENENEGAKALVFVFDSSDNSTEPLSAVDFYDYVAKGIISVEGQKWSEDNAKLTVVDENGVSWLLRNRRGANVDITRLEKAPKISPEDAEILTTDEEMQQIAAELAEKEKAEGRVAPYDLEKAQRELEEMEAESDTAPYPDVSPRNEEELQRVMVERGIVFDSAETVSENAENPLEGTEVLSQPVLADETDTGADEEQPTDWRSMAAQLSASAEENEVAEPVEENHSGVSETVEAAEVEDAEDALSGLTQRFQPVEEEPEVEADAVVADVMNALLGSVPEGSGVVIVDGGNISVNDDGEVEHTGGGTVTVIGDVPEIEDAVDSLSGLANRYTKADINVTAEVVAKTSAVTEKPAKKKSTKKAAGKTIPVFPMTKKFTYSGQTYIVEVNIENAPHCEEFWETGLLIDKTSNDFMFFCGNDTEIYLPQICVDSLAIKDRTLQCVDGLLSKYLRGADGKAVSLYNTCIGKKSSIQKCAPFSEGLSAKTEKPVKFVISVAVKSK